MKWIKTAFDQYDDALGLRYVRADYIDELILDSEPCEDTKTGFIFKIKGVRYDNPEGDYELSGYETREEAERSLLDLIKELNHDG